MNFAGCLRPAACSQRPASFVALGDGSQTHSARVILTNRPALGGLLRGSKCQLSCSKARKGILTITAASRKSTQQVYDRHAPGYAAWPEPSIVQGFHISWQAILKVLLLIPVFTLPSFLPSFSRQALAARAQPARTVEVWPANQGPRQVATVSDSIRHHDSHSHELSSTHSDAWGDDNLPSDSHTITRGGFVDSSTHRHSSPDVQVPHVSAESPSTRVAVFVSCGVALLFLLRATQLRHAAAANDRQLQNWRQQDAGGLDPNASPAAAAAVGGIAGRALPVQERQAQAKQDIAAAKAREAAFAGQGSRQFTDVDIAKPDTPDSKPKSGRPPSPATATLALDDVQTPSASQQIGKRQASPSRPPSKGSPTDTFVLGQDDSKEPADRSATDTFELEQGLSQPEGDTPTGTFILDSDSTQGSSPGSSGSSQGQSEQSRRPSVSEADTSGPLYEQGRAGLKPGDTEKQGASAEAELSKQQQQQQNLGPGPAAADASEASDASGRGKSESTYEPDTSKPLYTQGRADLKPRNTDEQSARRAAEAELKAKSKQTSTPAVSAAEAVQKADAEKSAAHQSQQPDTGKPDAARRSKADKPDITSYPLDIPSTAADEPSASVSSASSKTAAGGRAPAGEHEARENAMAELKAQSQQQQQPVAGESSGLADAVSKSRASDKQQGPASPQQSQQQPTPMSERQQTSDLASGLSGASMSAQPRLATSDQPVTSGSSSPSQTSPLQAQQAASSQPSTASSASSLAPAQQEAPNPLQGVLSAFQGLLGRQTTTTPSGASSLVSQQVRPPTLTPEQQAQLSSADASAAQRMAASNQALAAGKGQPRVRREVPVKRYADVDLPGDVTEFVRARGLRAPLVLLAGLAASAAQTLEPLWPVQSDSRGRKRSAGSDDPLDWQRYQKYDIFRDLLGAAAASPAAQGEEYSPFRALVNAVPQEGVPKYDFLRSMLQGVLSSPTAAPDSGLARGILKAPQRAAGPEGTAVRSKYDPFHTLLQRAQEEPSWPAEGPGFDPLAAAFQEASEPWYPLITKYDPVRALFNAQDPTRSPAPGLDPFGGLLQQVRQPKAPQKAAKVKLDPFPELFRAKEPSTGASPLDPLGSLLDNVRQPWQQSVDSKYDPFQALFKAEGPSSEAAKLDPLGNLLQSIRQAELRPADSSKYDVFQAVFSADGPGTETAPLDPLGNLLQNVGQPGQAAVNSKYDPFQALFSADGPSSEVAPLDPLGNLLQNVDQLRPAESSKYDAFQALFSADGPSSEVAPLDPLGNLLQNVDQLRQAKPSKYDAFQALFSAEGPSSEVAPLDPLGNLLQNVDQLSQAKSSKYDAFQALFSADGPSSEVAPLDPLGNLLQNIDQLRPAESSKYDAFQALFSAEGPSSEVAPLDPLGNLLQNPRQAAVRSKYDVFQALFNADGPSTKTAPLDPLGNLLQNMGQRRQAAVRSKYDIFQALFNASGPSEQAAALDPLAALLENGRQPWRSLNSKYDPFQAIFNAQDVSGDAPLDPLPHVIRGLKARAQLALHRKGAGPGAATTRLDKYDLVQQILSGGPASGPVPGFDLVGNLLKSSWLKEQQQRSLSGPDSGFTQPRSRSFSGSTSQTAAPSSAGRAAGNAYQVWQQGPAGLRRQGRQASAAETGQDEEAERPSEWTGFIYNPYSGDLLPPEGDNDEDEDGGGGSQDRGDVGAAYGGRRAAGGGRAGSGKPQFVSANAFRAAPSSAKRSTQVQALSAAAATAAVTSSCEDAAPVENAPSLSADTLGVCMRLEQ